MTHKDVAKILQISQPAYSNKENGVTEFSISDIMEICKALEFNPRFIVEDINIDAADLRAIGNPLRDEVLKAVQTLNDQQLNRLNEFINTL